MNCLLPSFINYQLIPDLVSSVAHFLGSATTAHTPWRILKQIPDILFYVLESFD